MRRKNRINPEHVTKGLGWFSIGIGLAGILAHRKICRQLGTKKDKRAIVCAYGAREILNGAAILASRNPTPWIWVKVAGDVLDLATLANGLKGSSSRTRQRNIALAIAAVTAVTAVDIMCAKKPHQKIPANRLLKSYKRRSGFPRSPQAMRGIALEDFEIPYDQFDHAVRFPSSLQ